MTEHEFSEWRYRARRSDNIALIVTTAIKFGTVCAVGICGLGSVMVLAGRHTIADIGIHVLGKFWISDAFAYIFGATGVGYGVRERRLRRRVNQELGSRVSELEKEIDSGRSSSLLTPTGQTNPEDVR